MNKLRALFASVTLGISSFVHAAVPTEAATAVTDLITDAGTFIASLWPLVVAVIIGFIFMKLFKKGVSKAT